MPRMAQLPRHTSQDTTRERDPFLLSWHLWNVQENCCQHSSCTWALGQGHDCYPGVRYWPFVSTCTALHRSYANVVVKSSPFLITNAIVYAKLVCPSSDCLGPSPQPAHPWVRGRQGPPTPMLQLMRVDVKISQNLNLLVVLSRQQYCGYRGRIKNPYIKVFHLG